MWSKEAHKATPDGYTGVTPVVLLEEKEMTIIWGDSKSAGGKEKAWKAVVIRRGSDSVSAIALDVGSNASTTMLYTMDTKRGFLYMTSHKDNDLLNASGSTSFVATCRQN
jgi:hypothetical protein